jgi:hypothetical protein
MRIDRNQGLLLCDHCVSQLEEPTTIQHLELLSETSAIRPPRRYR